MFARRSPRTTRSRDTPGDDLLTGLRGKDVIVVFVESYGRVAVQDSAFSPQVDAVLNARDQPRCATAGFSSRSAFLTSPTFGGISWLAHSTLQSGLWVDSQQRYDQLVASDRFTLSDAFKRAGWRTVGDVPSNAADWPQGTSFYHYDKIYDAAQRRLRRAESSATPPCPTSTRCPRSSALELSPSPTDAPVMAEIDLVSSPHAVGAAAPHGRLERGRRRLGLRRHARAGPVTRRSSGATPADVQAAYGQSIQYSLQRAGLVRADVPRQQPGARRARRPPAGHHRQRGRARATTCRSRSSPTTRT